MPAAASSRAFCAAVAPLGLWLITLQAAVHAAAGLRVTILNDVPAHFEVLAGAVATARTYLEVAPQVVWMTPHQNSCARRPAGGAPRRLRPPPYGLLSWLGDSPDDPNWHHLALCTAPDAPSVPDQMRAALDWGPTDMLLCISPELDKDTTCHEAARVLRPRLVVALVHRADMISRGSRFLGGAPAPLQLMALAPHVATAVSRRLRDAFPVGWAALVAPYHPPKECATKACLTGFTVQGTLRKWSSSKGSGMIRNFSGLWGQLLQPGPAAALNVTVLGKGNRRDLELPPQLEPRVEFHSGLPYPDFWQIIYTSYALVPAFGNNQYLTTRISSSVLASLITCVPLIASQQILDVYSFLREEHVFLQHPGEREVDVMVRVAALGEGQVFARRRALCRLRQELGRRAALELREALARAAEAGARAEPGTSTTTTTATAIPGRTRR